MGSSTKRTEQDVGAANAAPASSRARAKRALPIRSSPVTTAPSLRAKLASLETPAKRAAPASARTKPKKPPFARNPVLQELEPRLLMSADLNPLSGDALLSSLALAGAEFRNIADHGAPTVVTSAAVAPIQRTNELVFVDTATPDYQKLVDQMRESALGQGRHLEFVLIDQEKDGIRKVTDTLAKRSGLDAIHIVSHAQDGSVQLGSSRLDFDSLVKRAASIKRWGAALTEAGDILFYGCDLAASAEGKSLLDALSRLTGADVAASEDLTGSAAKGGDWDLEFQVGAVETRIAPTAAIAQWRGLLAPAVAVTPGTTTTTEAGGTGGFSVVLAEAPTADVTIPISSSDTTEGRLSSVSLTFTTGNWNVAQVVTVTGMDDSQPDGDVGFTVATGDPTSADPGYNALTATDVADVVFTNTDDERMQSNLLALYTFEENGGATVNDVTGSPLDLTIADLPNVTWSPGYLTVNADTIISSGVAATKIITGAQATDALTVEAWVKSAAVNLPDGQPHRLVTVSSDTSNRNFTLLQNDAGDGPPASAYGARLRANAGDPNGVSVQPFTPAGDATTNLDHVVFTHDAAGNERLYVNGVLRYSGSRPGDFSSWDAGFELAVANEFTRDRDWLGELHLVAIYGRALSAAEVQRNFAAAADEHTLIVDTANDVADGDTASIESLLNDRGTDGFISLREAILATNNTSNAAAPDRIHFNIAGAGVRTINIAAELPYMTDAVIIDGTTQGGFAGTPLIELAATGPVGTVHEGLYLDTGSWGSTIKGLIINGFRWAIDVVGSSNNVITGNFLGTNATGTAADANWIGVWLGTSNNTVGGTSAADRNIISGNTVDGVQISGTTGGGGNVVIGNYIGLDVTGTVDLGNTQPGRGDLQRQRQNNTIGGTAAGAGNVISGNNGEGVRLIHAGTTGNVVLGNRIGTNAAGTAAIGNGADGIAISGGASGNTIGGSAAGAGNLISGNLQSGIRIDGDGNTVAGNWIGLDATGTAGAGNGIDGVVIVDLATNNTIGGIGANDRNVISGNGDEGVSIDGAIGTVVIGNYIGTNAAGTAVIGNGGDGVAIQFDAVNTTVGGTTVAERNIIAGNGSNAVNGLANVRIRHAATTSNVVLGNYIGTNWNATATLANPGYGVLVSEDASGNTIGGTAAGAGNLIAGSALDGVAVIDTGTGNRVLGNGVYGNAGLGIDLADDGVSANDAGDGDGGPNALQNFPVLTSANVSGGNVTIAGSLNSTASRTFRIEFFASTAADASGNGEGERYLGSMDVTTDAGGNAFFTSAPLAGVVAGEIISATATDLTTGDTSEFAANVTALAPGSIFGTLHHDVDADADVAEAGTLTFASATVRLYVDDGDGVIDAGDALAATTTTDAAGLYSFIGLASNTYYVVVDSMTLSADPNVWAEQTYGAAGAASGAGFTGAAGAVYGGRNAGVSDNAAAVTTAEHVTRVAVAGAAVNGVDAGFSFNVVTSARGDNVDDDGANPRMQQGTLRQFILNANAIVGPNAMRFAPAVATNDTDGLGNNWWQITPTAALPQITGADTAIDGTAYFATVNGAARNDNAGVLGAGGTVGVGGLALAQVARPELEIVDGAAVAFGLDVNGANVVVRALALSGFNTADIVVRNVANVTIEGNVIGTSAASFTDPGAAARSADEGIRVVSGDGGTIRGNLIGFHGDEGVQLNGGADNWLVEGNEIRGNGVTAAVGDGLNLTSVITGTTVRGNLLAANAAAGAYVTAGSASNTIVNNTVSGNGIAGSEQFGIIFSGVGAGNVADRNVVTANTGVGIHIENGGTGAVTVIGNQVTANTAGGVRVAGSNGHTIGGTGAGEGNVISNNAGNGITFSVVTSGRVQGNTITGNFDPTPLPVPDTGAGVHIEGSSGVTVGGTTAGSRNVISGNQTQGVFIGFNSSNNWVAGNYLGTDATGTVAQGNGHSGVLLYWNADDNTIGGTTAAARNLISGNGVGVWIEESSDNNVVSANYIGVDASGAADLGNGSAGVIVNVNSQGNRIGGALAGERNVISGNGSSGVLIQNGANGTLVAGNYIGTNAAGTAALQNDGGGVGINNSANVTIGGAAAGAGNLISGHTTQAGIGLWGNSIGAVIQGNRIGTDATGTLALGNFIGVSFGGAAWNGRIGGTGAGEGNLIAFNTYNGVEIGAGSTGVSVLGNAIHSNGALGINLVDAADPPNGVTANDAGDADVGANRLQNFPVLTSANVTGANITIAGALDSALGGSFRLEFFASSAADASGYGEGERYLGFLNVTDGGMNDADATANGTIVFSTTLVPAQAVLGGEAVSATATALATGDTSEFSANRLANTTPVNTVPATASVNEDTSLAFTGANTISVADGQNNVNQVVLTVTNGTLAATAAGGAGVAGGGAPSVTITGTQAAINATLTSLTYQGALNYNGADTLTVVSTDAGGMSDTDAVAITVNPVNDAPVAVDDSYTVVEDSTLTVGWWDTDWTRRQQITFNNTSIGGFAPAETLSNFPVLLVLDSTKVDYALTQGDGGDLRFFDADGTPLAYEVERWDEAGNSYVWVKVPQIDIGATDSITMYYGNAGVADGEDPSAVWAGTGFRSVYHLDGVGPTVEDATSTNYDGTATNGATGGQTGQIGPAYGFDAVNDYINLGDDRSFVDGASAVTFSAWVNPNNNDGVNPNIILSSSINNGGAPSGTSRMTIELDPFGDVKLIVRSDDSATATVFTTGAPVTAGAWHYITGVVDVDTNAITVYVDGVARPITPGPYTLPGTAFPNSPSASASIGSSDEGVGPYFDGRIDEARIATAARTAGWIQAEYRAMSNQAGTEFVAFGAAQVAPALGGVLNNDTDAEGNRLGSTVVTNVSNGTLTLNGDGTFVYTPNPDFFGTDTFTYRANDGALDSNVATVTITVTPVNDAPTAIAPASYSATEQVTLDLRNTGLVVGDIDAAAASVTVNLSVVSGTLTATAGTTGASIAGSGSATLTLTGTVTQINNLLLGAGGATLDYVIASDTPPATDTLTLAIDDGGNTGLGGALNASANSTINISAINDAPVNTVPVSITVTEDVASPITGISIADVDASAGNVLVTLSVNSGTLAAATGGGVTVGGSGSGTLTLTGTVANVNAFIAASSVTFITALNATAPVTLTVTTDDQGNSPAPAQTDVDTVTLNVTAVNDAPAGANATVVTAEDVAYTFALADFGFSDPNDAPANAFFAVRITTLPLAGTLTNNAVAVNPGDFVLAADIALGRLVFTPAADANGPGYASFTFQVQDDGGTALGGVDLDASPNTITVDVTAVNDAPVNAIPAAQIVNEDAALIFSAGNGNRFRSPTSTRARASSMSPSQSPTAR